MKWFRQSSIEPLAVSMPGVRLGDRLLVIGCSDPLLIAKLAVKAGLTGRACAVDDDKALVTAAAEFAEREGALIETAHTPGWSLPYEEAAFDVVVLRDILSAGTERAAAVREALRILRHGGRAVALDGSPSAGLGALFRAKRAPLDADTATRALAAAGFLAVRSLAERNGILFVEGVRAGERTEGTEGTGF